MAVSEARRRANEKYNAKAYEQIMIRVKMGRKAELQAYAKAKGDSVNGLLNRFIEELLAQAVADGIVGDGFGNSAPLADGDI